MPDCSFYVANSMFRFYISSSESVVSIPSFSLAEIIKYSTGTHCSVEILLALNLSNQETVLYTVYYGVILTNESLLMTHAKYKTN